MVLGVEETDTIVLAIAVVIALVTAVTRLLRTLEAMAGAPLLCRCHFSSFVPSLPLFTFLDQ